MAAFIWILSSMLQFLCGRDQSYSETSSVLHTVQCFISFTLTGNLTWRCSLTFLSRLFTSAIVWNLQIILQLKEREKERQRPRALWRETLDNNLLVINHNESQKPKSQHPPFRNPSNIITCKILRLLSPSNYTFKRNVSPLKNFLKTVSKQKQHLRDKECDSQECGTINY